MLCCFSVTWRHCSFAKVHSHYNGEQRYLMLSFKVYHSAELDSWSISLIWMIVNKYILYYIAINAVCKLQYISLGNKYSIVLFGYHNLDIILKYVL